MGRLGVIFCLPRTVDRDGFIEPAPVQWPTEPLAYVGLLVSKRPPIRTWVCTVLSQQRIQRVLPKAP